MASTEQVRLMPVRDEDVALLERFLVDDQAAGFVSWWAVSHGPRGSRCWQIGIGLLPEHGGRGAGAAAFSGALLREARDTLLHSRTGCPPVLLHPDSVGETGTYVLHLCLSAVTSSA